MNLAPIGIITYSRIDHLIKTIESLKKNDLALESELFIFIDGPKVGDEKKVNVIKEYAHTIDGFKKVHIQARTTNNRIQNYFDGAGFILKKYGRIIFLEDDNVVSPSFLEYMNNGLEFYKDDKSIISIGGYNIPIKFTNYKYSSYKSFYFNAWGFATWANRETLKIEHYNGQYTEVLADKELYKKIKKIHPKLLAGLKQIHDGTLNAGDLKLVFHQIKNNLYTIKPIQSFVDNIGHDGSGIHCGVNDRFKNTVLNTNKIEFFEDLKYDENIDKQYYYHFHPKRNLLKKIKNKIKRMYFNEK